jgi:glutamate--cysteine ligase
MMFERVGQKIIQHRARLEEFFREEAQGLIPPFYLSCDIRHSGKKIAVIDTNLFPAGFNNLCQTYSRQAISAIKLYFNKYYSTSRKIIILCEEHTRNRYYLENVHRLQTLIASAGLEVRVAYPGLEISTPTLEVPLGEDRSLQMGRIEIIQGQPTVGNFVADLVVSNNDFSQGLPASLTPIAERIIPSPVLGWHSRRKGTHFSILEELFHKVARVLEIDPWFLMGLHRSVPVKDLASPQDLKNLADAVSTVMTEVQEKYRQYDINDPPYVFIKNEAGTYGMGLWIVSDSEEVLRMNRRTRNKLQSAKGGITPEAFLVQEGIPTADFYSGLPIEPVIYMIGFEPIGGFFRMNEQRDALSSLNTPGMSFSCLCLHKLDEPHEENFLNCAEKENLVQMSMVMAKVATLAAAKEQAQLNN